MNGMNQVMTMAKAALVALASIGLASCASQAQTPDAKAATKSLLKVLTYNIHHANPPAQEKVIDLAAIAKVIQDSDADLVALQEVDVHTMRAGKAVDQAQELGRLTGRKVFFAKGIDFEGGEYGIAILSKFPFLKTESMPLPMKEGAGGEPRVLAWVVVEPVKGRKIVFANTHLDLKLENRALQVKAIAEKLGDLPTPVVLCGDLNAPPASDDIAVLDAKFQRSEANFGFTIPAVFPLKEIDYVMFRPANQWEVRQHTVVDERHASDHRPVLVQLAF